MSEYVELVKQLRDYSATRKGEIAELTREAADAIETLQGQLSVCMEGTKVRLVKNDDGTTEIRFENQWIPVTEKLPKEWWPVLGLIKFHDEDEPPAHQVLWYLGNGHWREVWRGDMIENNVTHWMPLPEPPKEET